MNSIIEEMKRQQGETGTAPQADPVIEQMKALTQASHAQAALAVSLSSSENADVAARNATLAKRYNTTPEVVSAFPQEFKDRMALENARASLNNAPRLQDTINANPNTAAIIHDDLHNASSIEQTVRPQQYMSEWTAPEQGETLRERMSNYWRGLFGMQSVQEERRGKREAEANAIRVGRMGNPDLSENEAFEVSRKAVGGMSPAAQIAAERFIDSATFGLIAPTDETKARSWQQSVSGAGGQLAGFMVGPAKVAGRLITPLERAAGESFVKGFSKSVINEAATLALATAAEKSGHALLDTHSTDEAGKVMGDALSGGALMGATFGGAKKLFPDNTLPQWLARAVGVSAAQDYAEGTSPLDERVPLEDRLLKYFLNAAFTIHGGGRSEGGWLKDAAASKVAEQDFNQLSTLGQLSAASKWRERDPDGFKNFVRSTTEDGHLATVYVDAETFLQSMQQAGVSAVDVQRTMPDVVAQIKEATETKGFITIPAEDYATHIAGGKLDQALLPHLKTDPEGKTYAEAQQFYQEQAEKMKEAAAGMVKEKTEADAFRTSQKAVQDTIQAQLDQVNRFPSDVNRINASVQSAIISRIALREKITPEQAFEKYGAKVVGEGTGGFNQETRDLLIQHNLSADNLMHAVKMGGIPVPSLAITKKEAPLTNFGEITLLGDRGLANPRGGAKVFGADIYSPRYPEVSYKLEGKALKKLNEALKPYREEGEREIYGGEINRVDDLTYDKAFKRYAAEKIGEDANKWSKTKTLASDLLTDAGATERLFKGFDYNGNRRYVAHTLENVVKTLKKDLRGGESFNYGVGSLRAKLTPEFKSIEQIQKNKDRLMSAEDFEAVKKEVDDQLVSISNDLNLSLDQTLEVIEDAPKMGAIRAIERAFKDYGDGGSPTEAQVKDVAEYLTKLRNLPTAYFEAKILRNVGLDEFRAAVVPEGVEPKVIEALKERGITDVRTYKSGDEADRAAKIGEFDELFFQDARGSYMPDERRIALLKNADLSTYLHETGHWALDIYSKIATHPEATPEIKTDMDTLLNWFGVESLEKWNSMSIDEQRPHHEQLARGFEAYLMEGKAPSAELSPVFARIRAWMVNIYKALKNLNVELTPEVRGVFDRMLATDEAIAEAQTTRAFAPLPREVFESDAAYTEYLHGAEESTAEAIADMQAKSVRDMKWLSNAKSRELKKLQKQAEGQRKKVEEEVTAEVDQMPIYAAERWIRKGETKSPNGDTIQVDKEGLPGTKLNTERIKEMYPDTMLNRPDMEKLKGLTGPKGMDPDMMADMFGFRSGDELVRNLIDREPRESVIEGLTDKRMLEEHGEMSTPGAVEAAANAAVANDARARFVATGLKVLAKSPISARELVRGAREAAEAAIAQKRVRDLNPRQYEAAEARANKDAIKFAAKDPAKAVEAQRASLLNNQLSKATRQAQEDIEKAVDHFKKLGKGTVQENMRGEFLEQMNALLARFDLRTSITKPDQNRLPIADWVVAEAERLSAVMPDLPEWITNEGYRVHYSELSVEQVRGLRDTIKQLEHMARREQKQYMAIRAMEFADERGQVLDEIRKNWSKAFDEEGNPKGIEPDFVPSLKKSIGKLGDKFAGEFLNPETILSILGGGKFTVVNESLFGRLSSRSDWKAEKLESLYKELKPLFDQYSLKEKYDFARKDIATPAGLDTPLTRENALVVALLHGNPEGQERLTNYGWNMQKQQAIIELLDARDVKLANAIWSMFDKTLWPELKKLNDDTRGKSPPKVEAVPYATDAGVWSGGYFKLKYDTNLDERAQRIDEGQAVKELLGNGMGMGAKTNQGSSTERKQDVRLRPRLDLGVFSEAVNETVHDLAYREAVADTMRMLNDKGIQNAVKQVVGVEGYRALVTRVREVAAPPRNPTGFVESTIAVARRNTVINLMSGVKTALQNFTGLAPAFAEVNAGTLGREIAAFYSPKMVERYEFAMEQSTYMRQRFSNYDRDLNTQIKKLTVNGSVRPDESTFLALMGFIDKGVSVPVWNAAFKQGMERFENDTAKSVDYADHVVRQSQGSGRDVDLAAIMSGHGGWGQLKKAFTMFYSYFNGQLNLLTKHAVVAHLEAKDDPAVAAGKMAAKFIAIVAVPTVLTELLMHGYTQDDETDEERRLRFAGAFVKYGAGFFPFVRDIVPGIWAQATGDHFITPKISAIDSALEGVVKAGKSAADYVKGEADERDTKNLIMGVGYLVGAPGKLISDAIEGTRQWLNGEAGPQAILLGPPPKR